MPLTDTACRNAKAGATAKKLSDSGGLQLWIQPTGSKLWRVAYRFCGKQKLLAVGAYPALTLLEARRARDDAKRLLAAGVDPSAAKQAARRATLAATEHSFRVIAEEYAAKLQREGRAEATLKKVHWLLSLAYSALGERPIRTISAGDVLDVLRRIESRGRYETARRLRATISSVFRYAVATARTDSDPTFALQGALTRSTPRSRAAITTSPAFGGLFRAIWAYDGAPETIAALQLMAYLFPRPGELRQAEWQEFDMDARVWVIPGPRTKMRRAHRVPLPPQAVEKLERLFLLTGHGKYVFPSVRSSSRCMSENTLNGALRRLGYSKDEATSHGFRASASTLLNESGLWHPDAIERALAHIESNDVRRAYARGEHWDERVRMAAWWADRCDTLRSVRV